MADFNRDLPATINHPHLVKFLKTCEEACKDDIITFKEYKSEAFYDFWESCLILEWHESKHDFRYVYWGPRLTQLYGLDLKGKYIADGDHKETENPFIEAHLESMREHKRIYLGGTIDWRNKGFRKWNQVIQPLRRNGAINETLTYVTFN